MDPNSDLSMAGDWVVVERPIIAICPGLEQTGYFSKTVH
jgi:hypothetical protein